MNDRVPLVLQGPSQGFVMTSHSPQTAGEHLVLLLLFSCLQKRVYIPRLCCSSYTYILCCTYHTVQCHKLKCFQGPRQVIQTSKANTVRRAFVDSEGACSTKHFVFIFFQNTSSRMGSRPPSHPFVSPGSHAWFPSG